MIELTRYFPKQAAYFPDWHVSARLTVLHGNGDDIIVFGRAGAANREKAAVHRLSCGRLLSVIVSRKPWGDAGGKLSAIHSLSVRNPVQRQVSNAVFPRETATLHSSWSNTPHSAQMSSDYRTWKRRVREDRHPKCELLECIQEHGWETLNDTLLLTNINRARCCQKQYLNRIGVLNE